MTFSIQRVTGSVIERLPSRYDVNLMLNRVFVYPTRVAINYIGNRFIIKSHCLPTTLEVGGFHTHEERLLYGIFQSIVDIVELNCAMEARSCELDDVSPSCTPKWSYCNWPRRSKELGIKYLHYLIYNEVLVEPAIELLILYTWWTTIRPLRLENAESASDEMQKQYNEEDEEMMIRVIRNRNKYDWRF